MANPYAITPASPMGGMNLLFEGVSKGAEFDREKLKKDTLNKKRQDSVGIIQNGTIDDIQKLMIENPDIASEIDNAYKFKNEATEQNAIDTAWAITTGQKDPVDAMVERSEFVLDQGGDPTGSMSVAEGALKDPEVAKKEAAILLMRKDTAAWNAFQKSGTPPKTKEPTAKIQQWNEYNRLKKEDPEQATLFASSVGIVESPEVGAFNFTDDEKDRMAVEFSESGKYPIPGRSKEVRQLNAEIKKRSLEQQKAKGISDVATLYNRLDKKGMQKDIDGQQVKLGSMRSFIGNIDKQAAKIELVGAKMKRFDTKFLNIPLNKVIDAVGDADRATFRLLIGEMSEEIGKLASGATNSVAALSEGGREKWDKIFDTNLSYADMMELVKESKEIAHMRVDSMKDSLKESRKIIRKTPRSKQAAPKYNEGDTANGGKLIFSGGAWKDNI